MADQDPIAPLGSDDSDDETASAKGVNTRSRNDLGKEVEAREFDEGSDVESQQDPRAARKAAKKRMKAERRAKREGGADSNVGQKSCNTCGRSVDLLIRCRIDETLEWRMVCGRCWHSVSGGVVDGDDAHPHYQYGGLWKNRTKR
jgi:hypothetical protein